MKPQNIAQLISTLLSLSLLVSCGGSSNIDSSDKSQTQIEIALENIASFAENGKVSPTLVDFNNANITGVNLENISQVNSTISQLNYQDADTAEEIQSIINNLSNERINDTISPVISLNGINPTIVQINESYSELGVSITDNLDNNLVAVTSGIVNNSMIGSYSINYTATDSSGNIASITRTVNVVATPDVPPKLTINGSNPMEVERGREYIEQGITISDDKDNNLNVKITGAVNTSKIGSYIIFYSVTDNAGNNSKISRIINIVEPHDVTPPIISLNGSNLIEITQGSVYSDPGATALDDKDGNIIVSISGSVDTTQIGSYEIIYRASDGTGNSSSTRRIVNIVQGTSNTKPVAQANSDRIEITVGDNTITLNSTTSYDADGFINEYLWQEGLSVISNNESLSISDLSVGTHLITLTVVDNEGARDSTVVTVIVNNTVDAQQEDGKNYYVSTTGNDNNNGLSISQAFKTILKAAEKAKAGETVNILGGTYREGNILNIRNSGEPGKYITYKAYNNQKVLIKGSVLVDAAWQHYQGNIWKLPSKESDFSGLDRSVHYQQVFYQDGKRLQKVGNPNYRSDAVWDVGHYVPIEKCIGTPFGMCEGTFYVNKLNENNFDLYVWLPDQKTPNDTNVTMEVSDKRIIWDANNNSFLRFQGLTFMHTAAQAFAAGRHRQGGFALKIGNRGSIVENCTFAYTDFVGLSLSGNGSNAIVRNSKFHHNGAVGLTLGAKGFLLEDNEFYENGRRPFTQYWHTGAIKATSDAWGEIAHNYIHDERAQGIWFDSCDSGNLISIHHNLLKNIGLPYGNSLRKLPFRGHGIFLEHTDNVKVYNNIIANTQQRGIYIAASADANIHNNLVVDSGIEQIAITGRNNERLKDLTIENNVLHRSNNENDIANSKDFNIFEASQVNPNTSDFIFNNNIFLNENNAYRIYRLDLLDFSMTENTQGSPSMILFNKGNSNTSINHWTIPNNSIIKQKGIELDFLSKNKFLR
ncbi:MAG: immunoglobulin-like domain-containing protein [Cocleimonas sp.]